MARSLSMQRTVVTPGDRQKFLDRMKAREAHYKASGCNFWVFEEAALSGAFIEFTEDGSGSFGFIAVQGEVDCREVERDGRPGV